MRFRVLGVLQVEIDGVAAQLGGARQRAVLAVLLMHANEPVATDRLVSESWGENAPATATKTAQVYVSRLRGVLGNDMVTTTAGGYLLRVPQGALDIDELDQLRVRARESDPVRLAAYCARAWPSGEGRRTQICVTRRRCKPRSHASKSCD